MMIFAYVKHFCQVISTEASHSTGWAQWLKHRLKKKGKQFYKSLYFNFVIGHLNQLLNTSWCIKICLSVIIDKHSTCWLPFLRATLLIYLPPVELPAIWTFFTHLRWRFLPQHLEHRDINSSFTVMVWERVGRNGCKCKPPSGISKKGILFSRRTKSLFLFGNSFPLPSPDVYVPWAEYWIDNLCDWTQS